MEELLTDEFAQTTGMFQSGALQKMLDAQAKGRGDYSYPLFSLLVLAIWWENWMTRTAPTRCRKRNVAPTRVHRLSDPGADS